MSDTSGLRNDNTTVSQGAADVTRDAWSYWIDACQRGILTLDVLQQRSVHYRENAENLPHMCSILALSSSWMDASYHSQ